jgi:hypothetical protein
MTRRPIVQGILLCCVTLARSAAGQGCTPFGNVPRPMVTDTTVLTCLGGTMMPTWSDADGTPRRACLYEPATASAARRCR